LSLCSPETWTMFDVDDVAQLYDSTVIAIVDRMIPIRTVCCRRRPSDPWFDQDCRQSKRCVRYLERVVRRTDLTDVTAVIMVTAIWTARLRAYREMLQCKRKAFWKTKIDAERSSPRQLWCSVNSLMGRGRDTSALGVSADELHKFFNDKVSALRASTSDVPPPTVSTVPLGCSFNSFQPLIAEDVIGAVRALPDKQCCSDTLPTRLLC